MAENCAFQGHLARVASGSRAENWEITPTIGLARPSSCQHTPDAALTMRGRAGRVEYLRAGEEDHAGAGGEEQPAGDARILGEVELASSAGADRDRIDDRPGFETVLDQEKSYQLLHHGPKRANSGPMAEIRHLWPAPQLD